MTTVWVTRAQTGAARTAAGVEALGFRAIVAPLLQVRAVGAGPLDVSGAGALAFTSVNGVEAFAARCAARDLPVYVVGAGTAAAAARAAFRQVTSAEGHVGDLARLIGQSRAGLRGPVVYPGPRQPAGDLAGALATLGVQTVKVAVYETVEAALSPDLLALTSGVEAVLLHSPKAASVLTRLLRARPSPDLAAVCLSPAVAAPLARLPLRGVWVAAAPSEQALLDALQAIAPRRPVGQD